MQEDSGASSKSRFVQLQLTTVECAQQGLIARYFREDTAMNERPVLRLGDRGNEVQRLQDELIALGYDPGPPDAIFGQQTETAVVALQSDNGIVADGIVGPATSQLILALLGQPAVHANTDWSTVPVHSRIRVVMTALVQTYGYPQEGAAGMVGNLLAESELLPNRLEGSGSNSPMRTRDFSGAMVEFTADEVMNRDRSTERGPAKPGVGLAQWTSAARRRGLFQHPFRGAALGADVLFDIDAQIDYLDTELQTKYGDVHLCLADPLTTRGGASDEVLYNFEVPGAILDAGAKLPRTDARVVAVFQRRRALADQALSAYLSAP